MAEDLGLKDESTTNPCCSEWKDKLLKLQKRLQKSDELRAALKQGLGLYEREFDSLKKAYEEEKLQTEHERKDKEKESAARVALENEISALKSELLSSGQKGGTILDDAGDELILLRGRVSESEKEINHLQQRLQKEISQVAAHRMEVIEEKKRADEACKRSKADNRRLVEEVNNLKAQLHTVETEKKQLRKDLQNSDVVAPLQGHVSKMETEISRLKELLDKERKRADSETKKAETEKKRANKLQEMLKAGQSNADEQRRLVEVERKKAEELACQLERLKCEADDARAKLVTESSKFKEVNKKLETERKKLAKEKRQFEEQQKLSMKNALEEKQRADHLHQQVEEYQQKYAKLKKEMEEFASYKVVGVPAYVPGKRTHAGELKAGGQGEEKVNGTSATSPVKSQGQVKKKANRARSCESVEKEKEAEQKKAGEIYKRQAVTEKTRTDKLGHQKDMAAESAEMKLLKKRLKFEKDRVKHANQVAELEKYHKRTVEEELHRIKLELAQFSNRVGFCSCFAFCNNGNETSQRNFMQTEEYPLHLQVGKELLNPTCAATILSEYFRPTLDCAAMSLPISGTCTGSTSGTASKMEPMLGGSNRKKLGSSVIVPSLASFSCGQVGSLGKHDISNTKKAEKAKEMSNIQLPISPLSNEANRTSYTAVVADNNVKSPLRGRTKDGNTRKRKRLLDAIESIDHLYTEDKMWHAKIAKNMSALHDILGHMNKPLKEGMSSDYDQQERKRDACFEEASVQPCISLEGKNEPGHRTVADEDADFNANENNIGETNTFNDYLDKFGSKDADIIKRILDGDYMKLLDLDNAVEEERYCAAVAMPVSPTLPNIEFESYQSGDLNDPGLSKRSKVNCSSHGLPSKEVNFNMSTVKAYCDSLETFRNCKAGKANTMHVTSASANKDQDSIAAMAVPNSGHKKTKRSSRNDSGSAYDDSLYLVAFPEIRDNSSLFKIYHTTKTFTTQCCGFSQSDYMVKSVVSALSADETLSPKEKVCVFFWLFLRSFSSTALTYFNHVFDENFLNSVDIFSHHLRQVMSDAETRTMFAEVCNLDELISLLQNFIINGMVLVHTNISSETPSPSESEVDIQLNNESVPLSSQKASLHQLVLGAVLLASVCAAFDRTDSVCEASYSISHISSSSTLTFLHVFARICGEKLSAHGDYSLIMTVINSLVTYYEKENLSSGFPLCTKCPFSEGAVSMEELASHLLQRLWNCPSCVQCKDDSTARCRHDSGMTTLKSIEVLDGTLSNWCVVLSLLELLSSTMTWGWVCENIICQLLKLLEVCEVETTLTAVLVLLGQLARFGIDANGFQDAEVENIRVKLSSFISRSISSKISSSVQFAAVNALQGTMPLSFQEVCKNSKELPPLVSTSTPTECIQKWLSLLSDEQKSLSFKLLTAGDS